MTEDDLKRKWVERLYEIGALWEYQGGPLVAQMTLSSRVTDFYFNSDVVHSYPSLTQHLCEEVFVPEIASRRLKPRVVLTFAPFGLPIATVLSLQLDARLGYLTSTDNLSYYPGQQEQSVIVTDDIWSGSSVRRILKCLSRRGLEPPRVIIAIGNCSMEEAVDGIEIYALFKRPANTWAFEDSPFAHMQGVELVKARDQWDRFSG